MTTVLTEHLHAGAFIVSEEEGLYSRDQIMISNLTAKTPGTVLGKSGVPGAETATVAADTGNVGTGALVMDATAPIAATAIDGVYEVILRATGATASFDVIDPNGIVVDAGLVGTTFNNQIKFLLSSAGTMTIGDRWFVTISRPVGTGDTWDALNFGAVNGLQIVAGILFGDVDLGAGSQAAAAIVRTAQVRLADLTWPAGATAAQIAEGVNQLRRLGIIVR
ncbi:putative Head decoration protein [Methylocella tundrae]|uniref:Putative Head decoration protein n=1 Tax=Methylocella tundrae TaxID=227605 RepID=A0A8B6MBW1_METTU|nr:head decoration protein [Methylocella tundrae]VTZ27900.1 putative Head decoration protein [Methylocella tundrae]VTZ52490.1 putative Head decoration protein [Methylocella tundrae]